MFGKVIDGMLTVRKMENVPTGQNSRPKLDVRIVGESFLSYLINLSLKDSNSRVRRDVVFLFVRKSNELHIIIGSPPRSVLIFISSLL